ncbi:MAG: deoxyribonuclease IV [Phycisphaerae bacterium]|nr:deoxyribonuclease IV [Phycisphaerae bacterium]
MTKKPKLTLGSHLSIAGGLHNALTAAREYRCDCVQLFVANQRQWKHPPLTAVQIDDFKQTREATGISPVVAHSSYLINLCAANEDTRKKGIAALMDEYGRCGELGVDYLVLHPGAHVGQGEAVGTAKIVEALEMLFTAYPDPDCQLLLETTAGQGSCLGHTFEQLANIINGVKRQWRGHEGNLPLGVCLDTCHVFAAGYDFRTPQGYEKMISQFDEHIGLSLLKVIHANDSKTELNNHVDRHEHIGKGHIGREGFINLLTDERINGLPIILETPKGKSKGGKEMDLLNLAALRRLARL